MKVINLMSYTVLLILTCSFVQCACAETHNGESPQVFIQDFYNWYTPIALKDNSLPAVDTTLKEKANLFSQELYTALADDSDVRKKNPGVIAGLDFDPFLATQDPCEAYKVGKTIDGDNEIRVEIYGICEGVKSANPAVVVGLSKKGSQWVIDNFYYPPYDSSGKDLLSTLRFLKMKREINKKQERDNKEKKGKGGSRNRSQVLY